MYFYQDVSLIPGRETKTPLAERQLNPHALEPTLQLEKPVHHNIEPNKDPAQLT